MKKVAGAARRAIIDYNMIQKGDCIAVGVSGGKDSLTLLTVLASLRRYIPESFTLKAITVEMGFDGVSAENIAGYCKKLGVEYITEKTGIARVLFDIRKEKNPCSLCANLRRGALNNIAAANGCNKVAIGHHLDDVIETFFLSLFYEARISCFSPVTYLDRKGITVIRPLIYANEKDIRSFAKRFALPVLHNPCPKDGNSKREYIKQLLLRLEKENPDVRQRIFRAVKTKLLDAGKDCV